MLEEKKKIIITEQEAINKIIQKLHNRKIICGKKDKYRQDIINENFIMKIGSAYYYPGWSNEERNYDKVNIQISTQEYPHTRRRFNEFNITTGNYKNLVEKVKFIIQEDIKKKQEKQTKENSERNNFKILKEKLKGLGARKEQYGDNLIIKTKYFKVNFSATDTGIDVYLEDSRNLTIEQAIEMINKLK